MPSKDKFIIESRKEHESNLIDNGTKEKLLRVAAIYGANASGKSNLYMAMRYFQRIIVESLNNVDDDSMTAIESYYEPYKFEEEMDNSEFQIIEIIGDFEYKYGFEYNDKCIVTEWLYRKNLNTKRTVPIFERSFEKIEFGSFVRKECDLYKDQIPAETLVLSFFNKLKMKTDIFSEVYNGIIDILVVPTNFCEDTRLLKALLPKVIDYDKDKLVSFLSAIDTGIKDIGYDDSEKDIRFYTVHKGKDNNDYPLGLFLNQREQLKALCYLYMQEMLF